MNGQHTDILLIGGGIMSTTLATLVAHLDNSRSVTLIEQSERLGEESSDAWNNAGTGHAGYCELNYTPQSADGAIAVDRALQINEQFEISLQFWSSLVEKGALPQADSFIRNVPHLSWVQGKEACQFLKKRHAALERHPLFQEMAFSDQPSQVSDWLPLIMGGRSSIAPTAATRVGHGSDVNFGTLTRSLGNSLSLRDNADVRLSTRVVDIKRTSKGWIVSLKNVVTGEKSSLSAKFVFVGAGGAALHLLQKARIPEARGYGGFPVSGLWLACKDQTLATNHFAKVYSQAPVGAPPMSVPHLDTRFIDGKPALLFGPFAGFTTKFLKSGSPSDLMKSVRAHNLRNLADVATANWPLTQYLIKEALSSKSARIRQLQGFLPDADPEQWHIRRAGQRVQIIKPDHRNRGKLEFGTEVLATADRSMAALLGASPGASTCVSAMLDVIERCLPDLLDGEGRQKIQALIPSYGQSLRNDSQLLEGVRRYTSETLGLAPTSSQSPSERSIYA